MVYVAIGGPGVGRCLSALGGGCLGVAPTAAVLGPAVTDASGRARLHVTIPNGAPVGPTFGFEAWIPRGTNEPASRSAVPQRAITRPNRALDGAVSLVSVGLTGSSASFDVALQIAPPLAEPAASSTTWTAQLSTL